MNPVQSTVIFIYTDDVDIWFSPAYVGYLVFCKGSDSHCIDGNRNSSNALLVLDWLEINAWSEFTQVRRKKKSGGLFYKQISNLKLLLAGGSLFENDHCRSTKTLLFVLPTLMVRLDKAHWCAFKYALNACSWTCFHHKVRQGAPSSRFLLLLFTSANLSSRVSPVKGVYCDSRVQSVSLELKNTSRATHYHRFLRSCKLYSLSLSYNFKLPPPMLSCKSPDLLFYT